MTEQDPSGISQQATEPFGFPPVNSLQLHSGHAGQATQGEPFVIRGHHLPHYGDLLKYPLVSPEGHAKGARKLYESLRKAADRHEKFSQRLKNINFLQTPLDLYYDLKILFIPELARKQERYVKDVIGTTPEQIDTFEKSNVELFKKFLSLPDEYPVKLVAGQVDDMCKTSSIGKHCRVRYGYSEFRSGDIVWADQLQIMRFLRLAEAKKRSDDVSIVKEYVVFPDADPEQVESVLTTAGTVKNVLKTNRIIAYLCS